MQDFKILAEKFINYFQKKHFPSQPQNLYNAAEYILELGGKKVRPALVLMGNELFNEIDNDAYLAATAIELFHNFSLIHDDIMDIAPLRRGQPTVHIKWGNDTALLAGDVMLVKAYEYLTQMKTTHLQEMLKIFNKTASEVCEGQQMDMDFEKLKQIDIDKYIEMITLKTSVLLAASLQMGAIIGGASTGNQQALYEFGKNLGIAFQIQDDYLDCFGDANKVGKQAGGDILAHKKTFLWIHTMQQSSPDECLAFEELYLNKDENLVEKILEIYKAKEADKWALELKQHYFDKAMQFLEQVAVISKRKEPLIELSNFLIQREY